MPAGTSLESLRKEFPLAWEIQKQELSLAHTAGELRTPYRRATLAPLICRCDRLGEVFLRAAIAGAGW